MGSSINPFGVESKYTISFLQAVEKMDMYMESLPEQVKTEDGKKIAGESLSCGIYGLRGAGKSRFLTKYFSEEKRRALAEAGQLYPIITTKRNPDPEVWLQDICEELALCVEKYVPKTERDNWTVETESEKNILTSGGGTQDKLEKMVAFLRKNGYAVSLVLDEFHCISQSETVRDAQYEDFREKHNNERTRLHYVVATDLDFDPENENHTAEFKTSFFVHTVNKQSLSINGVDEEECNRYIESFLPEGDTTLTAEDKAWIFRMTGGLPSVINTVAGVVYSFRSKRIGDKKSIEEKCYSEVEGQFDEWCKTLRDEQKALLKETIQTGDLDRAFRDWENKAFKILVNRGFIVGETDIGPYHYCSTLFRLYIQNHFEKEHAERYAAMMDETAGKRLQALRLAEDLLADIEEKLSETEGALTNDKIRARLMKLQKEAKGIKMKLEDPACSPTAIMKHDTKRDKLKLQFKEIIG